MTGRRRSPAPVGPTYVLGVRVLKKSQILAVASGSPGRKPHPDPPPERRVHRASAHRRSSSRPWITRSPFFMDPTKENSILGHVAKAR